MGGSPLFAFFSSFSHHDGPLAFGGRKEGRVTGTAQHIPRLLASYHTSSWCTIAHFVGIVTGVLCFCSCYCCLFSQSRENVYPPA